MKTFIFMPIRLALVAASIATSSFANAASFDCDKAKTKFEKFICQEPSLNKADEAMGAAYRNAVKVFPVRGFVQAYQALFLRDYPECFGMSKPPERLATCLNALEIHTKDLTNLASSRVFGWTQANEKYDPDIGLIWIFERDGKYVLNWFGHYMPDMHRPRPFPDGFICSGNMILTRAGNKLKSDPENFEATLLPNAIEITEINCGPRMGAFRGTYEEAPRLKSKH